MHFDPNAVKQSALQQGFATVGIAPAVPISEALSTYESWLAADFHGEMAYLADHQSLKSHPEHLLEGAKSVIAVTLNYYQPAPEGPKVARYALGRDYHKVLRSKLRRVVAAIVHEHPGSRSRICVDSAPILDRAYASLAGLGWFGKNTMLIDSLRGSWFFIGLIVTTVEFETDAPSKGGCGKCTECIDQCPTGAIVQLNGRWQVDARSCISYQTIEKKGSLGVDTGGWLFGCDVCQEVCPFNQPRSSQPLRAQLTGEPDFVSRRTWGHLDQLVNLTYEEWDAKTQGSAIRRAGYDGLIRNAQALQVVDDLAEKPATTA